jgi:hypothetical protein
MPESIFKEEQKKEEERREEEQKRKKKEKQEERSPEIESRKGEIEKGADKGMAFGEAKVLTEVKYAKVHIKGTLASETYEPVVKEERAVKLIEEEHKKEERKMEEVRKEKSVTKESMKEKEATERTITERETRAEVTKTKVAAPAPELKRVAITREETIRREIVRKDREQLAKLMDEARTKGMKEPTKEIASKLFQYYTQRGIKPTVALGRVIMAMKRLGILKKKDTKGISNFLKSLFPK